MRLGRETDGAEVVEFALVLLPLMGFVYLIVDLAWIIFAQAVLQFAVREGVRYAVTGQTMAGMTQGPSIDAVIENHALGLVQDSNIVVHFYNPSTFKASNNAGGNIVVIQLSGVKVSPLAPLLRSGAAISLAAQSSDVMEGAGDSTPPPF